MKKIIHLPLTNEEEEDLYSSHSGKKMQVFVDNFLTHTTTTTPGVTEEQTSAQ